MPQHMPFTANNLGIAEEIRHTFEVGSRLLNSAKECFENDCLESLHGKIILSSPNTNLSLLVNTFRLVQRWKRY